MSNDETITPARACERVRLEFGAAIEQIAGVAKSNMLIAQEMYSHVEAALEARVFRLCQMAEAHGRRQGQLQERRTMILRAGDTLRVGQAPPARRAQPPRLPIGDTRPLSAPGIE